MTRLATAALAVWAISAGPVTAQTKTDPALDKIAKAFVEAFNAHDAAKVSMFYAEDATLMPPNHPPVQGRGAIQAYFAAEFKQGLGDLRLKPTHSELTGSYAFEAGTIDVQVGPSARDRGKYVVVYQRVGSEWKLKYDIFNSDAPPK